MSDESRRLNINKRMHCEHVQQSQLGHCSDLLFRQSVHIKKTFFGSCRHRRDNCRCWYIDTDIQIGLFLDLQLIWNLHTSRLQMVNQPLKEGLLRARNSVNVKAKYYCTQVFAQKPSITSISFSFFLGECLCLYSYNHLIVCSQNLV